ncbi:MAG TPA: Sir2 family NAD-dependent protein deacetylase [Kofleriaceae bacterium]
MTRARSLRTEAIDAVGSLLTQVQSALIITGQALSAESGLTHYRGIAGLTRRTAEDAKRFEAALSVEGFARRPVLTWEVLLEMDRMVRTAQPSAGHHALVALERGLPRLTIMTINIDRLHQRAGSRDVIEMHGALHDLRCPRCELTTRHDSYAGLPVPPRCATCGEVLRPDMPLFGESLPPDPFTRLQAELEQGFDLVCAVGINTMFPYLARPLLVAKQDGIPTVEIGQNKTDLTEVVDFALTGSPARMLEAVASVFTRLRAPH